MIYVLIFMGFVSVNGVSGSVTTSEYLDIKSCQSAGKSAVDLWISDRSWSHSARFICVPKSITY